MLLHLKKVQSGAREIFGRIQFINLLNEPNCDPETPHENQVIIPDGVPPDFKYTLKCIRALFIGKAFVSLLKQKVEMHHRQGLVHYKLWKLFRSSRYGQECKGKQAMVVAAMEERREANEDDIATGSTFANEYMERQLALLEEAQKHEAVKFWRLYNVFETNWLAFWSDYKKKYMKDVSKARLVEAEGWLRGKLTAADSRVDVCAFRAVILNELDFPFDLGKAEKSFRNPELAFTLHEIFEEAKLIIEQLREVGVKENHWPFSPLTFNVGLSGTFNVANNRMEQVSSDMCPTVLRSLYESEQWPECLSNRSLSLENEGFAVERARNPLSLGKHRFGHPGKHKFELEIKDCYKVMGKGNGQKVLPDQMKECKINDVAITGSWICEGSIEYAETVRNRHIFVPYSSSGHDGREKWFCPIVELQPSPLPVKVNPESEAKRGGKGSENNPVMTEVKESGSSEKDVGLDSSGSSAEQGSKANIGSETKTLKKTWIQAWALRFYKEEILEVCKQLYLCTNGEEEWAYDFELLVLHYQSEASYIEVLEALVGGVYEHCSQRDSLHRWTGVLQHLLEVIAKVGS